MMSRRSALIVTVVSLFFNSFGIESVRAQQVPVLEGPLTADCPFGICPKTDQPRTASDFYQLFGYLPEPYASQFRVRSTPPANWPKTYYTPKPGAAPVRNNVAATMPMNNVTPPPHKAPPPANVVSKTPPPGQPLIGPTGRKEGVIPPRSQQPVGASRNFPLSKSVVKLTPADTQEMKRQLRQQQTALLDKLSKLADNHAEAQAAIQKLRDAVTSGAVTPQQIAAVAKALQELPAGDRKAAQADLARIATNQQVTQWLDGNNGQATSPGTGGRLGAGNAFGGAGRQTNNPNDPGTGGRLGMSNAAGGAGNRNVPIGLVPGLPAGILIQIGNWLGGGPFLVGMGQPGNQIVIGMGDPFLAAGLPVAPWDAIPAADPPLTPLNVDDVLLSNAADAPVNYAVNDGNFTMQTGDIQTLPGGSDWIVSFDRGNGQGMATYQLVAGSYEFQLGTNGWDLFEKSYQATIDNTDSPTPFNFVLNNQQQTVPEGRSQTFTERAPPVLAFEDGTGQTKRRLLEGGDYQVALNSQSQLDLYPSDQIPDAGQSESAEFVGAPGAPTMQLPRGFELFNTTEALAAPDIGRTLPEAFSLFRETAEEIAAQQPAVPAPISPSEPTVTDPGADPSL
jgi:hypothetical protein